MSGEARSEQIPALVLGFGVIPLGAMRALGRKGVPQYAACYRNGVEKDSRWYRPVPGQWLSRPLADNLRECPLERAVVIPTSDESALEAASLPPDLAGRFPSSSADPDVLRVLTDKAKFSELLVREGIAHPHTRILNTPSDVDRLSDAEIEGGFLKPRNSLEFLRRYNRKSLRPSGRDELKQALARTSSEGLAMVLQEYVPGPASNCYLIDGFRDRNGVVCGTFARRRLRQFPLDFGNSSALRSVPRSDVEEAEAVLLELLEAISYRGIFNAEFKRDERDGSWRLFEINPRAWWYVEFAARCGVDTVTMAYQDAQELPVSVCREYDVGRTVVYPYYDMWACLGLWRTGQLGLLEMVGSWLKAEQVLFTRDDPRPFLRATWHLWKGFIARRLPWRKPPTRATDPRAL